MKLAKLFHNTTAGDEDHEASELLNQIRKQGIECNYSSTRKKELKKLNSNFDFLVVAGGDGTVRQITRSLLKRKNLEKPWPIALLPLGTANNIAKTLGIEGDTESLINEWEHSTLKSYDVGDIFQQKKEIGFFLESFGYGIFPRLMKKANGEIVDDGKSTEEKIVAAQKILLEIINTYKPRYCKIVADGKDLSGMYLMVEVMNSKAIGPNLTIAPEADPGDGHFELVLITEEKREALAAHVQNKIEGKEIEFDFSAIRVKELYLEWEGTNAHMDDELIKIRKSARVHIKSRHGLIQFLVPEK